MEQNGVNGTLVTSTDINEYIKGGWNELYCPQGATLYEESNVGTPPQCPNIETFTDHFIYTSN